MTTEQTVTTRQTSVVVIGAGQAGLSAAYHLQRRGFLSALTEPDATSATSEPPRTYVVLDAEPAPGGAWQHRWPSLTLGTVNHIFDLPGLAKPALSDNESSAEAIPRYFAAYEQKFGLAILRPWPVTAVRRVAGDPTGPLLVESARGNWHAEVVINATGTWTNPNRPDYPGSASFRGRQLHTGEYRCAEDLRGQRVAVVGAGISAIQQLEEISRVAETFWYTRRPPVFLDGDFVPEMQGRETVAKVVADVEAGRPTGSVVSYTGLFWTPYARAAQARGALEPRPMFSAIEPTGVREADGSLTPLDTILWATGFRPALSHLDPLELRNQLGGIAMTGTQVAIEPRVHLIGYGPSQSTVGANRAGRTAVAAAERFLPSR